MNKFSLSLVMSSKYDVQMNGWSPLDKFPAHDAQSSGGFQSWKWRENLILGELLITNPHTETFITDYFHTAIPLYYYEKQMLVSWLSGLKTQWPGALSIEEILGMRNSNLQGKRNLKSGHMWKYLHSPASLFSSPCFPISNHLKIYGKFCLEQKDYQKV